VQLAAPTIQAHDAHWIFRLAFPDRFRRLSHPANDFTACRVRGSRKTPSGVGIGRIPGSSDMLTLLHIEPAQIDFTI
jgi:hypothetical protein